MLPAAGLRGRCAVSLPAHSNLAMVSGNLLDPARRPLAEAAVELKTAWTDAVRASRASFEGAYEFAGLAPGDDREILFFGPGTFLFAGRPTSL